MAKKDDKDNKKDPKNTLKATAKGSAKDSKSKAKKTKDTKPAKPGEELTLDQKKQQLLDKAKKDGHLDQRDVFAVIAETPSMPKYSTRCTPNWQI